MAITAPPSLPGRILGVDLGEKRIGLALSDPLGIIAQPLTVLHRRGRPEDLDLLLAVAAEHHVQAMVFGLPHHLDGRLGSGAVEVQEWVAAVHQRLGIPVHTWDERLTTVEAERILLQADLSRRRRRQVIDKMAAVIILQAFLDHQAM